MSIPYNAAQIQILNAEEYEAKITLLTPAFVFFSHILDLPSLI